MLKTAFTNFYRSWDATGRQDLHSGPDRDPVQVGSEIENRSPEVQRQEGGRLLQRGHQVQASLQARFRGLVGDEEDLRSHRKLDRSRFRMCSGQLSEHSVRAQQPGVPDFLLGRKPGLYRALGSQYTHGESLYVYATRTMHAIPRGPFQHQLTLG